MNLNNMRVATKLWATIVGLLLVMMAAGLWLQSNTRSVLETSREDVQRIERKIALAQFMRGNFLRGLETAAAQLAASDDELRAAYTQRLGVRGKASNESLEAVRVALRTDLDREAFEKILKAYEHTTTVRKQGLQSIDPQDHRALANFALGTYSDAADALSQSITDFIAVQQQQLQAKLENSDQLAQRSTSIAWGLMLVLIVLGMVLARWLVHTIQQPLLQALSVADAIGNGQLDVQVRSQRRDEFGQLLHALENMAQRLRTVVTDVRESVHAVSSAAGQIASGGQDLSARTEQTAANLEETAASIEQLTATVNQAADTSRQANQLASTAAAAAERGGEVVNQVVMSMDQINTSSRKISDIIGVIDGIAFQTNILALNAAVEAARAGEQGRGFAVVAGEVRNLAQRSAEAAKEIKGLITTSVQNVDAGAQQVVQAGESMQEIVTSVRRVTDLIGEITAAATEQSQGFAQVNQAVSNLDQMTQQNAALVEESSAAANAMSDQANRLMQAVAIFQTGQAPVVRTANAAAPVAAAMPAQPLVRQGAASSASSKAQQPRKAPVVRALPASKGAAVPAAKPADDHWETF